MTQTDDRGRSTTGRPGPTVPCPQCGEIIPATAFRCRYCGSETGTGTSPDRKGRNSDGQKTDTASEEAWDDAFASISRRREPGGAHDNPPRRPYGAVVTGAGVFALTVVGVYLMYSGGDGGSPQVVKLAEESRITNPDTKGEAKPGMGRGVTNDGASSAEGSAGASGDRPGTPQPGPEEGPSAAENSTGNPSVGDSVRPAPEAGSGAGANKGASPGREMSDMHPFPDFVEPDDSTESVSGETPELPAGEGTAVQEMARENAAPERDAALKAPPDVPLPPAAPVPSQRDVAPHKAVSPSPPKKESANQAAISGRSGTETRLPPKAKGGPEKITAVGDLVAWVQRELSRRGFYPGPVDGRAGNSTRDAIRSYQRRQQMTPTGKIDATLTTHLRRTASRN